MRIYPEGWARSRRHVQHYYMQNSALSRFALCGSNARTARYVAASGLATAPEPRYAICAKCVRLRTARPTP